MKTLRNLIVPIITGIFMAGLALNFNACTEQSPFTPDDNDAGVVILAKKGGRNLSPTSTQTNSSMISTQSGSMTARYYKKWNTYQGGKIILSQGSQFELLYGSLTPPTELMGQDVTITMTCVNDEVNNELLFEFGPSGSQFDPAATVWFHYTGSNPKLFYIDKNGAYFEQQPDEIDTINQWLMLKINHFSRYAVAWSR